MSDRDPNERIETPPEAGREAPARQEPPPPAEAEHLRRLQKARQARVAKALVILVIAVLLIVFVIQNSDPTRVDFVFFSRHPRLIWVLVITALLGGIVGYLLGRPGKAARGKDEKKKR